MRLSNFIFSYLFLPLLSCSYLHFFLLLPILIFSFFFTSQHYTSSRISSQLLLSPLNLPFLHSTPLPHTDLPPDGLPLRPADKSIISLAAAAAVILASKIHEIRPLRTVRTYTCSPSIPPIIFLMHLIAAYCCQALYK